jgi:hypothetical protein
MNKFDKKVFLILGVILFTPILYYLLVNFNNEFSTDNIDLAYFSTYYIAFITLGNLLVFIYLSKKIHDYNISKDQENKLLQKSLNQPIISIIYDESVSPYYQIENIGNSPALNVILFVRYSSIDDNWDDSFNCFTLKTQRNIELELYRKVNAFGVLYNDVLGNKYASYMENNTLQVYDYSDSQFQKSKLFRLFNLSAKNHINHLPNENPPSL